MNAVNHKNFEVCTASRQRVSDEDLAKAFNSLKPMERLFFHQQLDGYLSGRDRKDGFANCFDDCVSREEFWRVYREEWLPGFDQGVIDAFNSGEWKAPLWGERLN